MDSWIGLDNGLITSHYLNQWWQSLLTHICVTWSWWDNTKSLLTWKLALGGGCIMGCPGRFMFGGGWWTGTCGGPWEPGCAGVAVLARGAGWAEEDWGWLVGSSSVTVPASVEMDTVGVRWLLLVAAETRTGVLSAAGRSSSPSRISSLPASAPSSEERKPMA